MSDPAISPPTIGGAMYTITNSNGVIAELNLSMIGTSVTFEVHYPPSATGVQAALFKGADASTTNPPDPAHTVNLLPGHAVDDKTTITGRHVQASTSTSVTDTVLSCTVSVTGGQAQEDWTLYVVALAGNTCVVTRGGDTNVSITRVMCDPVASFQGLPPGLTPSVNEKSTVTLTATLGTGTVMQPTVVGTPSPTVYYKWTLVPGATIAIPKFNSACGSDQEIFFFTAPGVYGDTTIQIQEKAWFGGGWFGGDCSLVPAPLLSKQTAPQSLTIKSSPQALMLLLDRTGSMAAADKWTDAKIAARLLAELFVAFRNHVNANDSVGIVGFDDTGCAWGSLANLVRLLDIKNTSPSDTLATQLFTLNLDPLGACTPIGDALIEGMKELANLPLTAADGPSYTMILLTDGIENSGLVYVDPNSIPPGTTGLDNFSHARGGISTLVNERLALFTIGVGADVQHSVLNALVASPVSGVSRNGQYISVLPGAPGVLNLRDVVMAVTQELMVSLEANSFIPYPSGALPPGSDPDPNPPANPVYFSLSEKTNRLAVAILSSQTSPWNDGDFIDLAHRQKDATGKFTGPFIGAGSISSKTFGFISVDVAALFPGGQSNVPATEWRVTHHSGAGEFTVYQPIDPLDLLLVQDLYLKAEVLFDKNEYRTGEPIHVTCRIAAGPTPVTGAVVAVTLERPGAGLGNFLSVNPPSGPVHKPGGNDPLNPKYTLLEQLLAQLNMSGLPILHPPAIFPDGSAFLFDDGVHNDGIANDGVYSNTYVDTDMEGTYTFNFYIEGKLADGSVFNRVITVSKWVGIAVDPINSLVSVLPAAQVQGNTQTAQVFVRPRDARGQFLGPYWTSEIEFRTSAGAFQGNLVTRPDGSYVQTLAYPTGQVPTVSVNVQGKDLLPRRTTNSGFMVQSTFGVKGNFELVVPHSTAGIIHCVRNNDDSPNFPWKEAEVFGTSVGKVDAVSLIQSNFGLPRHLEVIARAGDRLMHFWRDSGPEFKWHGPGIFAQGVSGNPALIQGRFGTRGNFELVVPLVNGGIAHYWRDNDDPQLPWRGTVFAEGGGLVDSVALVQSNYGSPLGNLEVVARVRGYLMHFWRDSGPTFTWYGPQIFYAGASGIPGFIQSKFGNRGAFEVVTPVSKGGMVHLQRDNDSPQRPWKVLEAFGSGSVTAVSLLQSNFTTSLNPDDLGAGNLEVAARVDDRTAHYWRRDEAPLTWLGPTAYACS